jgi:ankyrin repeat protein
MKHIDVRAISIRVVVFFLTFTFALGLALVRYTYDHRQAVFMEAAFRGDLGPMEILYPLGVDVNEAQTIRVVPIGEYRNCTNPILDASLEGHNDAIEFLVDHGADVNYVNRWGNNSLMVAAGQGHESTVRLLLSKGADVNAENDDGETALTLAKRKDNREIVRLLRLAGASETP